MTPSGEERLRRPGMAALGALLLATTLFCWPLLTEPALPRGSDCSYHSQWAHGFAAGLAEGILYPRWVGDVNRGHGAPIFLIYPPASFYAVAAASVLTGDVLSALRLVLVAAALIAGLCFYVAARDLCSELGAVAGAVLYVLLPYHGLDLYDRFAFAEYAAFLWFPLLFLATRRLAAGPDPGAWLLLAGSYAGLLLTHVMSAYLVLFALGPFALALAARGRRLAAVVPMAAAGLAGLLCASVYILPFLVNRDRVHTDWLDSPHYDWRRNFIYRDEVAFGYERDLAKPWAQRSASTQTILVVAAAGVLLLRRRGPGAAPDADVAAEGLLHVGLALWALFLQTPLSAPLWATLPELASAQFPWRFGALQMTSVAFTCAAALSRLPAPAAPRAGAPPVRVPTWAIVVVAVAAVPALGVTAAVTGARPYDLTPELARGDVYRYRVVNEYFPRGVEGWKEWRSVPFPEGSGVELRGTGTISDVTWSTEARRLHVEATSPVRVVLRTFDYPGWQARVDGEAAPIVPEGPSRLIAVDVPAGSHRLDVELRPTWDRRLGAVMSACGLALLLAVALRLP